jgi:hypothetical protein
MNIKSKAGLALLDAILSEEAWETHEGILGNIFDDTDIDWVNHSISTGINGKEVIAEYDELLQDEAMIEQLDIIQENINRIFQ